jgi:hypothetical protein
MEKLQLSREIAVQALPLLSGLSKKVPMFIEYASVFPYRHPHPVSFFLLIEQYCVDSTVFLAKLSP